MDTSKIIQWYTICCSRTICRDTGHGQDLYNTSWVFYLFVPTGIIPIRRCLSQKPQLASKNLMTVSLVKRPLWKLPICIILECFPDLEYISIWPPVFSVTEVRSFSQLWHNDIYNNVTEIKVYLFECNNLVLHLLLNCDLMFFSAF